MFSLRAGSAFSAEKLDEEKELDEEGNEEEEGEEEAEQFRLEFGGVEEFLAKASPFHNVPVLSKSLSDLTDNATKFSAHQVCIVCSQ